MDGGQVEGGGMRIVLAEDDLALRQAFVRQLQALGHDVVGFPDEIGRAHV